MTTIAPETLAALRGSLLQAVSIIDGIGAAVPVGQQEPPQQPAAPAIVSSGKPAPFAPAGRNLVFEELFLDPHATYPSDRFKTELYFDGRGGAYGKPDAVGFNRCMVGNGERQLYSDRPYNGVDPFVWTLGPQGNYLNIVAAPAPAGLRGNGPDAAYTSGMLSTEESFARSYGVFQASLCMPKGKGLWPAFWLLPVSKQWPPEIDGVEFFGGPNSRGEGGVSLYHCGMQVGGDGEPGIGDWVETGTDLTAGFHCYEVEWREDFCTFRLDGREMRKWPTRSNAHQPMYMVLTLAVGGNWPEDPDDGTVFPAALGVDYIRVYE